MTIMRKLATPSLATLALVAGVGFAMAQSGAGGGAGGGSGGASSGGSSGGNSGPGASSGAGVDSMPAQDMTKAKRSKKTTKRAKRQSKPSNGRPLGPTNTRS